MGLNIILVTLFAIDRNSFLPIFWAKITFGYTTSPMAKIPPLLTLFKQCANIFFTFLAKASCEIMDEFACPNPSMPSSASEDEPSSLIV